MNQVFKTFNEIFLVLYFDDILIFSTSKEEHIFHLQQIMRVLRQEKLYINMKKYAFMTTSVVLLGFVVSSRGVKGDQKRLKLSKNNQLQRPYMKCKASTGWHLSAEGLLKALVL